MCFVCALRLCEAVQNGECLWSGLRLKQLKKDPKDFLKTLGLCIFIICYYFTISRSSTSNIRMEFAGISPAGLAP